MTSADGALEVLVLAAETPVVDARVILYWWGERDPNTGSYPFANAGSVQTGRDGRAHLFARQGRYTVAVNHADFAPALAEVYRPSNEPVTKTTLVLQRGAEVRGETVREEDGTRIALVELTLSPRATIPSSERLRARSDHTGAFVIKGVAPGSYTLEARKEGEGSGRMYNVSLPDSERLVVKLEASSYLNGHVLSAKGDPAEGAHVTAIGQHQPLHTKSGRGGAFAIEVPRGTYTLQAVLGGETGAAIDAVRVGGGKTIEGVEIKLGAPASISGRITDAATNEPVLDARVDVSPYRENGDSGRARSDADGRFIVKPLAPGSYDVVVQTETHALQQRRGITLAAGEQFEMLFQVSRPGKIAGHVVDEQEQGVGGANVVMNGTETKTSDDGRFSFEGVRPDNVFLRAWRDNESGSQYTRVKVQAGATTEAKIVLPATAQVEVRVVDESTSAITAGLVWLEAVKGRNSARKELEGSSSIVFTVAAGTYKAVMRPTGKVDLSGKSAAIVLEPGDQKSVTLVVKPSGAEVISGIMLGIDGTPPSRGSIRLEPSDPTVMSAQTYWSITDPDGRFIVRKPLSNAQITYVVRGWDEQWHNSEPVPASGDLVLRLRPNGALSGTVQGRREGETLRIEYDSDTSDQTLEFAGAIFSFRDVPAAEDASVRVVSSLGRKGESKHVVIKSGETTQLTLSLD
jgi:hypothetical protein